MNAWRMPKAESFPHFYAWIPFLTSWALHICGAGAFIECLIVESNGDATTPSIPGHDVEVPLLLSKVEPQKKA